MLGKCFPLLLPRFYGAPRESHRARLCASRPGSDSTLEGRSRVFSVLLRCCPAHLWAHRWQLNWRAPPLSIIGAPWKQGGERALQTPFPCHKACAGTPERHERCFVPHSLLSYMPFVSVILHTLSLISGWILLHFCAFSLPWFEFWKSVWVSVGVWQPLQVFLSYIMKFCNFLFFTGDSFCAIIFTFIQRCKVLGFSLGSPRVFL